MQRGGGTLKRAAGRMLTTLETFLLSSCLPWSGMLPPRAMGTSPSWRGHISNMFGEWRKLANFQPSPERPAVPLVVSMEAKNESKESLTVCHSSLLFHLSPPLSCPPPHSSHLPPSFLLLGNQKKATQSSHSRLTFCSEWAFNSLILHYCTPCQRVFPGFYLALVHFKVYLDFQILDIALDKVIFLKTTFVFMFGYLQLSELSYWL